MPASAPDPDDKLVFDAFRRAGGREDLAYTAVQSIREMAAANLIARFEAMIAAQNAKLDSQNAMIAAQNAMIAAQNAKLDSQEAKLKMLMWMIGAAVAVIGVFVRLWG